MEGETGKKAGRWPCEVELLPAWTDCTRMLERLQQATSTSAQTSAQDAKKKLWLRGDDDISMNRDRVLFDAKARALAMADGYQAPNM
jgi:3-hydroxyacyl-CoA dehydrogenase